MLAAVGAAAWLHVHARTAYRGYGGTEQFVDIPAGSGSRAIGARLVEAGVVRDALTYRYALWLSGQSRALKAGDIPLRSPGDSHRGGAEARARRGLRRERNLPRRAEPDGDGDDLRISRPWHSRRLRGRSTRCFTDCRNRPQGSQPRGISVSGNLCPVAARKCRSTRQGHGCAVRARADIGSPQRSVGTRVVDSRSCDAGIDRRKGNRERPGTSADIGCLSESAETEDAAAVRSDGDLRPAARRKVHGQSAAGRSGR